MNTEVDGEQKLGLKGTSQRKQCMLNPRQDCVKWMGQTHQVVSSLSLVVCKPMGGYSKGIHPSGKLEEVVPGSKVGSPVPRCRNWNPWGEVV